MIHPRYWSLDSIYRRLFHNYPEEIRKGSERGTLWVDYLKPNGKVILDVGAYTGDTAKLFLAAGAKKVICIEPNREFARRIDLPNTEVIIERFCLDHLLIPHDAIKVNIEGYEMELLNYKGKLKRSLVSCHCWWITDHFLRAGWMPLKDPPSPMLGDCEVVNEL
jgi:hypothetical protein